MRAKLQVCDFVFSEMSCSKKLMPNYHLLPSLKPGSWKSPQLHLVSWSCQLSQAFTGPDSCVGFGKIAGCPHKSLLSILSGYICNGFPFSQLLTPVSPVLLSCLSCLSCPEQTSEPGDPKVSDSPIRPNILLLNMFSREIPCAAAFFHAVIPTNCQGWLAKLSLLVLQLSEDFSAKEQRGDTENSR